MRRKNILFITADQFRHDALGLHGAFPVRTPHLDRLAQEGCLFRNAYCANPLCVPSRAAIMTGQQSHENGVYYNDQNWPRETPTIPSLLAEGGFYCSKVGKTHFQPPYRYAGFHKIIGDFDLKDEYAVETATSDRPGWEGVIDRQYREKIQPTPMESYEPVVHTRIALEELSKIASRRECAGPEATEPFFFWLSYKKPHTPCNPPEPYRSMYDPDSMRDAIRADRELENFPPDIQRSAGYWTGIDEPLRRSFMARYLGCVTLLDDLIGRVLAFLETNGLRENTLIVFTSDHGDNLGDHHLQQKGNLHDCSSKIPLIFQGPGIAAGRQVEDNVSLIDLMSTFLDYSGLLMPDRRDDGGDPLYDQGLQTSGISLLPWLRPESPAAATDGSSRRVVVTEAAPYGQRIMLKQGTTKINYYPGSDRWEWFETAEDPDELNDLAGEERPPLTPEMEQALARVLADTEPLRKRSYYYEKIRPMFT